MTRDEIQIVNAYTVQVRQHLKRLGYTIKYQSDPASFAHFLEQQPETHGVSSIHDPRKSDIRARDFAWLLASQDGQPACCHAIKVHETEDLIDDIRTQRLFADLTVKDHIEDVGLCLDAEGIEIKGKVAIGGGLWVHPDHRHKGLGGSIALALRALGLPRFNYDHYIALLRKSRKDNAVGMGYKGHARFFDLSTGYYPPYERQQDIGMAHSTRDEVLDILRHAIDHGLY